MAYDTSAAAELPPVTDWLNDWDWLDPQWGPNAIEIWKGVRDTGCPMAMTERYGRAHMPVTMQAVSEVAKNTTDFSSIWVSVSRPDAPRMPAPPITSDQPEHRDHRRIILPAFSPKAIEPMEDDMRAYCQGLIADLDGKTDADAAVNYAQHIPVHGICQILGIPETDADLFRDWIYRNFQLAPRDNAVRVQLAEEMGAYFSDLLAERRKNPTDDLTSQVAHAQIDGKDVSDELKIGYLRLQIVAGIDTTWSAIASGLWHFGMNPSDRDRLAGVPFDDSLWGTATEEVLRYYSPVTMARKVLTDTEVAGCPVKAGDQMLLTFPAANHDPAAFENPGEFQIDRLVNRHVAFGLGIHRCAGSNLARLELLVALQEWIKAFPNYTVDITKETEWANGQVRGPRVLPVHLNR
ncbi:MAG: cytochrome P450 [Acidimicrobiales bacterium]